MVQYLQFRILEFPLIVSLKLEYQIAMQGGCFAHVFDFKGYAQCLDLDRRLVMLFGFVCSQHGFGDMAWTCWAWQEVLRALTAFDSNIQRLDSFHYMCDVKNPWCESCWVFACATSCNILVLPSPRSHSLETWPILTSAFFPPLFCSSTNLKGVLRDWNIGCTPCPDIYAKTYVCILYLYIYMYTLSCWRRGTGWVGNEWVGQHCIFHWWTAESLQEASLPLSGHFDEVESAFDAVRLSATQKKREAHLQNFSTPPGCLELRLSTTSSQGHFVARCNDEVQRIVYFRVM